MELEAASDNDDDSGDDDDRIRGQINTEEAKSNVKLKLLSLMQVNCSYCICQENKVCLVMSYNTTN